MSSIDEIKSRIDIVDLVSETVQLRRSGKNYTGFCPFHSNIRTPAFAVFPDSGTWRCFGQCNEGGDIFKFVMKREGVDFSEALRTLAEKAGVVLKAPTPEEQAAAEEHSALRALLEDAVTFFRHQLLNTTAGKPALEYLRQQRGLKDETLEAFGVGYAPAAGDALLAHFHSRGAPEAELLNAGLVSERESGGFYDRFRNRIMFPIRNEGGKMAGFGARILNPDDVPKFLNSPQTAVFDKGHLLYGLERARKSIRSLDQAVIVEGYLDVIALHQAGFTNVVSPMGTALTEQQFYLLKRFSKRIILALDSDAAGDKATLRGLQVARQAMDHQQEAVFDARGLLGYEARLKADIRVTALPTGLDPDEVVAAGAQEWEKIIQNARPVVIHVMETLASGRDIGDPKVKTEIAAQVLPLIHDVPNAVERDTYLQRLARLLRVNERALLELSPVRPRRRNPRRSELMQTSGSLLPSEAASLSVQSGFIQETHCMGILLRRPDFLFQIDRLLQEAQLPRLSPRDFQHADYQAILLLLQEAVDQDVAEPRDFILHHLSVPLMELADELLERTAQINLADDRLQNDLMRGLLDLRKRSLRQDLEYYQYLMGEAQADGDLRATQYSQSVVQLTRTMDKLNRALQKYTSHSAALRQLG